MSMLTHFLHNMSSILSVTNKVNLGGQAATDRPTVIEVRNTDTRYRDVESFHDKPLHQERTQSVSAAELTIETAKAGHTPLNAVNRNTARSITLPTSTTEDLSTNHAVSPPLVATGPATDKNIPDSAFLPSPSTVTIVGAQTCSHISSKPPPTPSPADAQELHKRQQTSINTHSQRGIQLRQAVKEQAVQRSFSRGARVEGNDRERKLEALKNIVDDRPVIILDLEPCHLWKDGKPRRCKDRSTTGISSGRGKRDRNEDDDDADLHEQEHPRKRRRMRVESKPRKSTQTKVAKSRTSRNHDSIAATITRKPTKSSTTKRRRV